jgi:hypothetical protein
VGLRRCVLLCFAALTLGCHRSESEKSWDGANTASSEQAMASGPTSDETGAANVTSGQANAGVRDAHAPAAPDGTKDGGMTDDSVTALSRGGVGATSLASDAGSASAGLDAASARPDWGGLVTLGPSVTTAPDGAVINRDSGFNHYDPDAAGPILNPAAQAACLMLANNICSHSADCQISLAQLSSSSRTQLVASCLDTWLLNHNCNRATRTASDFNTCAESVKTRDCVTVFASDFAMACLDKITLQP